MSKSEVDLARRTAAVELEQWQWRVVLSLLRETSSSMGNADVSARIAGDRLHVLSERIESQLDDA